MANDDGGLVAPDVIRKTQDSLGRYVKKPPLTEKLLKKPPFRFLHDVVTGLVRTTGFLNGLYTELEMQSENVKDRDSKIAFLQKLIDVVKTTTGKELTVKASKIVAGLEPTKTNELLQAIAYALDNKLDWSGATAAKRAKQQQDPEPKSKSKTKVSTTSSGSKLKSSPRQAKKPGKEPAVAKDRAKRPADTQQSGTPRSKTKETKKPNNVSPRKKDEKATIVAEQIRESLRNDNEDDDESGKQRAAAAEVDGSKEADAEKEDGAAIAPSENDQTKKSEIKISKTESPPAMAAPTEIKKEKTNDDQPLEMQRRSPVPKVEEEKLPEVVRVEEAKRSLRPPSVRPSSARPGAPRLRERNNADVVLRPGESATLGRVNVIVESGNKAADASLELEEDEEETVTVTVDVPVMQEQEKKPSVAAEDSGKLVATILEQIEESQPPGTTNVPAEPIPQRKRAEEATSKLREAVQTLTRTANPLGKLIGYLHEDVDAMRAELSSWKTVNEKLSEEMERRKASDEELIKPLLQQLERLDRDIQKQKELIAQTHASVIRNERKIKVLLSGS